MVANTEVSIFSRVVRPQNGGLSPEAARVLANLAFDPSDRDRMQELAAKSNEGRLTDDDREELDNYVRAGHLLALLQSKARLSLQRAGLTA